jgi:hypothetical protein
VILVDKTKERLRKEKRGEKPLKNIHHIVTLLLYSTIKKKKKREENTTHTYKNNKNDERGWFIPRFRFGKDGEPGGDQEGV